MGCITDDYKDAGGYWRKCRTTDGKNFITMSASRWQSLRDRCRAGSYFQSKCPTYIGCSMSPLFRDFQFFASWHASQIGYALSGYHLDKDILVKDNKVYSEETCVLVPQQLNNFLLDHGRARGDCKQGVTTDRDKYRAVLRKNGKRGHLGLFLTEDDAYAAYKAAKEAEARRWYERLKAGEYVVDERVIERLRTWTLEGE